MTSIARLQRENEELRRRLNEAENALRAAGDSQTGAARLRDVTNRDQSEDVAQQQLRDLENLYLNAPVGLCQLDSDLRFLRINERLAEINGIPAAAHVGRRVRDVMPELADAVEPGMRRILETGEPRLDVEVVSETPARPGVKRHWLEQWLPIKDAAGRVTGLSIVVEETTARKQAEETLEAHRRLLETVVDHMPASVTLIRGHDLRLQLVNPAYRAIAPGKDLVGKTLDEAWPETGRDFSTLCRRVLETGEPHHGIDEAFTIRRSNDGPLEQAYFTWSLHRVRLPGDEGWGILNTAWETTERMRAEQALRQSQQDLYRAQEVGQIGWWRLDTQDNVLTWSDENHRIFGLPLGTPLRYETFLGCIHPEDREYVDRRWRAALGGEPYDIEHRVVADGRVKWVREKAYLEFDDAGTPKGGFGITQDITDRKRAEDALRDSEARLKIAQLSAGAGVWEWDIRGGTLTWSDELFGLFGLDPSKGQATFDAWRGTVHPDDREPAERRIEAAVAEHAPLASEYRVVLPTGEVRWIAALGNTTYAGDGTPIRMSGICLDVTARKAAEAQIRQAEDDRKIAAVVAAERQRFLDVLETLPAMICLLTPDHRVVFANRGFREVFGEGEGRPCYAYRFGLTAPCDFCKTFSVLSTGQPHHWELTTPGGRIIAAHDLPFTDVDGSPMVLEMDVDITEQRRAEKALADAHEALAERASQLRALAGDVTLTEQRERRRLARILHDHIQQLLVAAKLRVAIMGRMGDASMQAAAAEVEQLLGDSISSARALTSELSPPVLHESGLLAGLGWLARWMGDKHGLAVDLSVAADLPRLAEDASVLLFESVRELLFNVVKHASAAPATVTVRRTEDDDIRIVVSDRGPGFDRDFGIVPDDVAGGFGLFSIRERLGLLGGRLIIENVPGAGSQISLTAPLARVVEAPAPATMPESPTGSPDAEAQAGQPGTSRRIRVLIADDHALVREGVGKLIAQEPDMEVAGDAADGGEAVRLADSLRPDVILMDAQMPVLDGVEATAVIHRDRPEIRVIGLSMFEAAERAQAMREAGAVDYVTKSDPPGELVAAIRRAACRREPE